jgi:hypothetical protein
MLQKLKEQIPAVIITGAVVVGAAFWFHQKTVADMNANQEAQLQTQRKDFEVQLKASAEETRKQIDAVDKMLKEAIQKRSADVFMNDEEIAKMNAEKVNQLAEAVAMKIQPNLPLPKTPEEAERIQNEQVDKVSGRMAEKIQPILAEMSKDQNLTRDQIAMYSQRITDQVGTVLTAELAKNQQLNNNLIATRAVAHESLALSHELTALYLSTFKDQGLVTRILSLPANVVKDVSRLSIVNSRDRKKIEEDLVKKMNAINDRLKEIEDQQPKK